MIRPARDNQFPPLWLRACQEGVDQIVKPLFRHEPPHRQYVTLWCKAQPFDDCHRIVIARRQAWGAVWNIRHLISLRRKQHCQLACQGRRYSAHAMGPDQRRTLTEAKSEFGKRAPFRALVIRTMMRDNNMEAQDAGQGAPQSRPYRMDMDDLGTHDPCVKYGKIGRAHV